MGSLLDCKACINSSVAPEFPGKPPTTWPWVLQACRYSPHPTPVQPSGPSLTLSSLELRRCGLKTESPWLLRERKERRGCEQMSILAWSSRLQFLLLGSPSRLPRLIPAAQRSPRPCNGRESPHLSEERSHADGSLVDVIVLITAIYISSPDYHKCLITAEEGFAWERFANYSFLGSSVTRPCWLEKEEGEEELRRGEGEKGPLSDLIKGRDLNRYLIKCLLPHNTGRSLCRQNRD